MLLFVRVLVTVTEIKLEKYRQLENSRKMSMYTSTGISSWSLYDINLFTDNNQQCVLIIWFSTTQKKLHKTFPTKVYRTLNNYIVSESQNCRALLTAWSNSIFVTSNWNSFTLNNWPQVFWLIGRDGTLRISLFGPSFVCWCVCVCVFTCKQMHKYVGVYEGQRTSLVFIFQMLSTLFFETGSLVWTHHHAWQFLRKIDWCGEPKSLPTLCTLPTELPSAWVELLKELIYFT